MCWTRSWWSGGEPGCQSGPCEWWPGCEPGSLAPRPGSPGGAARRVAVIEWVDPPFTAGHWIPDLVSAAGGRPVAACPGARSVPVTWAVIAAAAPDLIVVAPCGYHLPGAIEQARSAARALPGVPVWAIDADGIVVRPGPRLIDGVEAIASMLHPDAVPPAPPAAVHRVTARG